MKLQSSFATSLLALGLIATLRAQDIKLNIPGQAPATAPAPAAAPAPVPTPAKATPAGVKPAAPAFTESELLEEYGWFIGKRIGLADLNFSQAQIDTVLRGVALASQGKPSPNELAKIGPPMDELIKSKQDEYLAKLSAKGLAESAAFLTEVKKKPGVIVLKSGLCYEIVKPGEGPAPKLTDTVTVHYTGALVDGTVFDSSVQRGEPVVYPLDKMIPGWTEGLQKIAKGGKMKLYVPPDLAFGDEIQPGIPPSSTLVFEVEILDIKPTPPAPPAPAPAAAPKGK
jgi:FKBP-type peptidyl-prolyl cis-trans isomerase